MKQSIDILSVIDRKREHLTFYTPL